MNNCLKRMLPAVWMLLFFTSYSTQAQEGLSIKASPDMLELTVDGTAQVRALVVDPEGKPQANRKVFFYSRKRSAVSVDSLGMVTGLKAGTYKLILVSPDDQGDYIRLDYHVQVLHPPIAKVVIEQVPDKIYAGTTIPIKVDIFDEKGFERQDKRATMTSSNEEVASFDTFYNLTAKSTGTTTISAGIDGIEGSIAVEVSENPVAKVTISSNTVEARTGDVIRFETKAYDKKGKEVTDAPVSMSFQGKAFDVSSSADGLVRQDGRFVAYEPGQYTIMASSGSHLAQKTVEILPRNVSQKIELIGKGLVNEKHTSDFWIWEGVDGRDYGVTGTWGADGTAYFWDVTDPANIKRIDSIQVDARTVNDVKVSEDGKICIISREGASNRKNGIVIMDVTNPGDVQVISTFTENLTGGVHNLFIYQNHVYALSDGQKYYIINIDDPKEPKIVGKFELEEPGHAIHDVWVEDGIAYSSNWQDGVQLVDVGKGIAGGSPENPVAFASYKYPSGAHHATFPFKSKSTGKFYTILGDEIFPYGLNMDQPNMAGGFLHFVDFTDLENPEEVAKFEVPFAGSHNYWVDGETLYAAFYNGGVRVIDISGELMGDLNRQGREIAFIIPSDPNGYVPNAPFTWGAQLHKGHIFYSDWNSGLWAAKMKPENPANTKIQND